MKFPGLANSWGYPIKIRIDMLSTGIKTPVGLKFLGPDLDVLNRLAADAEGILKEVPGTTSAFAERVTGGYYLDFDIKRREAARYGLTVGDVQEVISSAMGGENITQTVEGLERYPVNLRYFQDYRQNLPALRRLLIPTPDGSQVPMEQVADIKVHQGPDMIKSEGSRRSAWVFVDIADIDVGTYVQKAKEAIAAHLKMPAGYSLLWSGQFEYMEAAAKRLKIIIPITLVLVFLLLYLNTRSLIKVGIVMLAVPFSLLGAIWLLYLLGYHLSVGVVVGMLALAGLDAETGVLMLLYLDIAHDRWKTRRPPQHRSGPARRHRIRRGHAGAPQAHDHPGQPAGPAAHHVGHRHRLRSGQAHRRPHGGRRGHLLPPGTPHLSGHLPAVEAA